MTEDSDIVTMANLLLTELEHTDKCKDAVKLSEDLYNVARPKIPEDEIIKAIERRLPQPHREYAEAASLSMNQEQLIITRPIGELEGKLIYVAKTPDGVYFGSVKPLPKPEIPAWDVTSPKTRRNRSVEA